MAALTVLRATRGGEQMSPVAADAGLSDTFVNDGKTLFLVFNGGGSACVITVDLALDPHSDEPTQSSTASNISVPNGEDHVLGPFPVTKFGTVVTINYDQVASVTVLPITQ